MNKFRKISFALMLTLCPIVLTSCSSFFGSSSYMIKEYSLTEDEEGNQILTFSFDSDEVQPLSVKIPKGMSGKDGVGIKNITHEIKDNNVILTIEYTDPTVKRTTLTVPIISGKDGRGIKEVEVKKDEAGNTTIQFIYSDETKSELITLPKGEDGKDGVGIANISFVKDELGNTVVTVTYTGDKASDTFTIENPKGIYRIEYDPISSTDTTYSLVITYTDGSTETISLPRPQSTKWLYGNETPSPSLGSDGDYYMNEKNGDIYRKNSGLWIYLFSLTGGSQEEVSHIVSFETNGGKWKFVEEGVSADATRKVTVDHASYVSLSSELLQVSKTGYTFAGWWTSPDYVLDPNAGHLTTLTSITSDITVYANWVEIK